ncbi:cobalt ECF transporter T component CbiQ [Corynebacterium sp. 13CS0277]|uniref:cobalt ECF transporter T component CbiQ n=1 Tax=Corynebacterium sp. 13CS0277 TaxID=2071994 RepID=UPI000D0329E0|nr:cobalt ECF transporter T component CbiQ [Corynebacterium sp. 13CS0277]PRQ11320.1 cobalt ECF transporter T component CbiQ [Corynebacterium sp. 13CS0277]
MNPLERAAAASRWAHASVAEKALGLLGLLLLAVSVPPWPLLPVIAALVLAAAVAARVPWRLYAALVAGPATFVLLGLVPLVWQVSRDGIHLIDGGVQDAATVLARCTVGMAATMLFAVTTPMAQLLVWLRAHGYPEELAHVTMMMYRMVGTLIATARTMWDAQAQRLGHSSPRRWVTSVASQAATLFVISISRARSLQEGLELRAPIGATATLDTVAPARPRVIALLGALLGALVIAAVLLRGH